MGVHNKASNAGVLGELGRYPLYISSVAGMVKYWHQLASSNVDCSCLLTAAYNTNMNVLCNVPDSWISSVKFVFTQLNLKTMYDCPQNFTTNQIIRKVIGKLKSVFRASWNDMLQASKLRTYRTFKGVFSFEPYLNIVKPYNHRVALTRFRISAHRLGIEVGRYKRIDLVKRTCNYCEEEHLDDELHYLLNCEQSWHRRTKLFKTISDICPNFILLDDNSKFTWLMVNEDRRVCSLVAEFIYRGTQERG